MGTSYSQAFMSYIIKNRFAMNPDDFLTLPKNTLKPHEDPFVFGKSSVLKQFETLHYKERGKAVAGNFNQVMEKSGTSALFLIKDDRIVYEGYFNGHDQSSQVKLYSITKSFVSALVGIAIERGMIRSVHDPITSYLPEVKIKKTIRELLQMDSGIRYEEGHVPWKDETKVYLHPDARKLALGVREDGQKGFFHYNDYHLLLLGLILERAAGMPVTEFFRKNLWEPLQPEYPGYLIVDSEKNRFEKLESGLAMTAVDLAKFGRLFLQKGNWDGRQIVPEGWVAESTGREGVPHEPSHFRYYQTHPWGRMWLNHGKGYYKYLWWGHLNREAGNDYFALGALGQVLYISPEHNAIGIRLGKKWGIKDWWPSILYNLINEL